MQIPRNQSPVVRVDDKNNGGGVSIRVSPTGLIPRQKHDPVRKQTQR